MPEPIFTSLHADYSAGRGAAPEGAAPFSFWVSFEKGSDLLPYWSLQGAVRMVPVGGLQNSAESACL
jgi:hypothetical protein